MLSAAAGAPGPADWAFDTGVRGKPRVSGVPGPHFNISHCDGLVACAVSCAVDIGVDVECLERSAPLELAGRYFAVAECALLSAMREAERPLGFFRLWTLKEAYIKATGLGLSQTLGDFSIGFDPLRVSFADPALGNSAAWQFRQTTVGPERHVLALAWRGVPLPVEITPVALEALLADATLAD
jgi:4'-phosphopantetheinyl transferase